MRTIIADDETIMLKRFVRISEDIPDINLVGKFDNGKSVVEYVKDNPVDLAFLDITMPVLDGFETAKQLRKIRPDILIVFISAHDNYLREFINVGGDYYILKPYNKKTLESTMERIRLLAQRQYKDIYINTFGRFTVMKNGNPLPLSGKTKEILALVVTKRGKEISNEEIYNTIWEGREYSNANMSVLYNALRRLKSILKKSDCSDLLISTTRGQMINTDLFDCDYYSWQDNKKDCRDKFNGEFLSEYTWGEYILADMLNKELW